MNLIQLRYRVRELTGVYATDLISDGLLADWLNEAYNEIARERNWDWLEESYSDEIPAAVNGVHTVNLDDGTRRVLSAYLVSADGNVEEMIQVPELDRIEDDEAHVYYDVTSAGVFRFAPEQQEGLTLKVRYTRTNLNLVDEFDEPSFDAQFHPILAYRAAVKVLQFISDDTNRSEFYMSEYASLLDGLIGFYELDHDYRTFQLGQDGVDTVKYFPWFRPA